MGKPRMGKLMWAERALTAEAAAEAARGLLAFAEIDLDRVSETVHRELVAQLVAFMEGGPTVNIEGKEAWEALRVMLRRSSFEPPPLERFYTVERLRPLQNALRDILAHLLDPAGGSPRWENRLELKQRLLRQPDGTMLMLNETSGDYLAAFLSQVFAVLLAVSPRLRRCAAPGCKRAFIACKRQAFCNPTHAARVRVARHAAMRRGRATR